jgi:hypothetical protein
MPSTSAASSLAAPAPTAANPGGCSSPKCRFERAEAAHAAGKIWS